MMQCEHECSYYVTESEGEHIVRLWQDVVPLYVDADLTTPA